MSAHPFSNRDLQSVLITLLLVAGFEVSARWLPGVPSPIPAFLVVVAACSCLGGFRSGILSALILFAYGFYLSSRPERLALLDPDFSHQLVMLVLGGSALVLFAGFLRHRADARERELKQLRNDLEAHRHELAELHRTKELFLHVLTQEVRHSQTTLIGFMEFARSEAETMGETELAKDLERAFGGYHEMNRLISNMVDIIRIEERKLPLKNEEFDVAELVEERMTPLANTIRSRNVNIKWNRPLWLPMVKGDRTVVGRVVENLLVDAIDRTPAGGVVQIAVATAFSGPGVEVMVKNSGQAIPVEHQDRLFEKFDRAGAVRLGRRTASGLGLAFCRAALEALGGKIWVQSQPGKGATFIFSLPMGTRQDSGR